MLHQQSSALRPFFPNIPDNCLFSVGTVHLFRRHLVVFLSVLSLTGLSQILLHDYVNLLGPA